MFPEDGSTGDIILWVPRTAAESQRFLILIDYAGMRKVVGNDELGFGTHSQPVICAVD
jgi:hypothetical protein